MFSNAHAAYVLHTRKLGQKGKQYSITATSYAKSYTSLPCQVFQLCLTVAKPFLEFFRLDQLRFTGQDEEQLASGCELK